MKRRATDVSRVAADRDELPPCAAPSSGWRPVLQVTRGHLNATGSQSLRDHPPLCGAVLQGVIGQSFQSGFGEPNGQHRRPIRAVCLGDRRGLLRCCCPSYSQHFVRRRYRHLPRALEAFQRPALTVFTYFVLTLAVLSSGAGRNPIARNSPISAAASIPALPEGMRPEKPISP